MSNILKFRAIETETPKSDEQLAFFKHAPRYPASQTVSGAVVGQVIVHPSSPDRSPKAFSASRPIEE